ncbi:hypothetical protein [Pseudolactococcus reticulitermitis]|uniref:Cystathionine beta-lyase n=1 Tax=Pseudolactococcus reticulitermitis TaxID=2025039 RepID=A0A224X681_9LACT|nr:hypothetical protein [Lactococcus reticulitermitis]GAX47010.1 hypothetical protein RsY01_591 [Lactococcus reticulitermitis]
MDYIELAIQAGGFMAMDRILLTNRLATLETAAEKLAYICPPPSVVNAYFAELYQKQGPEVATDYFLELSTTFKSFSAQPTFDLEGASHAPTFRFIRLNLSGQSFGFAYENTAGQAIVFPEFADTPITDDLLFEIAQLFPQYVVTLDNGRITMAVHDFGDFGESVALDALTTKSENAEYLKITALNITDGLAQYDKLVNHSICNKKMVQFSHRTFSLYIQKVGVK